MRMHLISASRRTDIPAFYAAWFMERVRVGTVSWVNPYRGGVSTISLLPEDVAAIVFWTRNFSPMMPHLNELEDRGHRWLVHFTLTGLPRRFETHVPSVKAAVRQMHRLAARVGAERILWRYDPILVSRECDLDDHRVGFTRLARALQGATRQCTVSFVEIYGKVRRSFEKRGLPLPEAGPENRRRLVDELAGIASSHGITLKACCSDELLGRGVEKARCVDRRQVVGIWPSLKLEAPPAPSREECGCTRSYDIGAYDSCLHGCVYCYATRDREVARARRATHVPTGACLIPGSSSPA
jgi:DNA repair photolyase